MKIKSRHTVSQSLILFVIVGVTLFSAGPGYSQDEPDKTIDMTMDIDPDAYPKLTGKSMGHVRHMVEIAEQLPGNWAYMGIPE